MKVIVRADGRFVLHFCSHTSKLLLIVKPTARQIVFTALFIVAWFGQALIPVAHARPAETPTSAHHEHHAVDTATDEDSSPLCSGLDAGCCLDRCECDVGHCPHFGLLSTQSPAEFFIPPFSFVVETLKPPSVSFTLLRPPTLT